MKGLAAGLMVVLGGLCASVCSYTASQIVDSLSKRLDRVVTYRADAIVYEYNS